MRPLILGNGEAGFVFHEVTICPNISQGRSFNLVSLAAQRGGFAQEVHNPESMLEEAFWERLDEDAIIIPDKMVALL
jgi:hypothetical protein